MAEPEIVLYYYKQKTNFQASGKSESKHEFEFVFANDRRKI